MNKIQADCILSQLYDYWKDTPIFEKFRHDADCT